MESEDDISDKQKRLTARVSPEIHLRVRQEALKRGVTVDRLIEDSVIQYLAGNVFIGETRVGDVGVFPSESSGNTINPVLPDSLVNNLALVKQRSQGVYYALELIVSKCAGSTTETDVSHSNRIRPIKPLAGNEQTD